MKEARVALEQQDPVGPREQSIKKVFDHGFDFVYQDALNC